MSSAYNSLMFFFFGFAHLLFAQQMAEQSGPHRFRRSANRSWRLCIWWRKAATTVGVKPQSSPHSTSPSLMSRSEERGTRPCLQWLRTAHVFIQSIPPLGKYERCCAATCSRLLTSYTNPFMTSLLRFFLYSFFLLFILQPCSWLHTQCSVKFDGSKFTNEFVFKVLCCFHPPSCILAYVQLTRHQAWTSAACSFVWWHPETRTPSFI